MDVLLFDLSGETLAAARETVAEVVPLGPVTPVPGMPAAVLGATHAAGRVVAVVDLSRLLRGVPGRPEQGAECLLLRSGDHEAVACCDRVVGAREGAAVPGEPGRVLVDGCAVRLMDTAGILDALQAEAVEIFAAMEVNPLGGARQDRWEGHLDTED